MNVKMIDEKPGTAIINGEVVNKTSSGESRICFRHNNTIFKFDPKWWREDGQCQAEVDFWYNIVRDEDKVFFAPIIAFGENWVAQDVIEFDPEFNPDNWAIVETLAANYNLKDLEEFKNWGTRADNGMPVIYDYGV